jgi:hypothetical protein
VSNFSCLAARNIADVIAYSDVYVDKIKTGFITWTQDIKAYTKVGENAPSSTWDSESQTTIDALADALGDVQFFDKLVTLWAQESSRSDAVPELRSDHVQFIKSIGELHISTLGRGLTSVQSKNVSRSLSRQSFVRTTTITYRSRSLQATGWCGNSCWITAWYDYSFLVDEMIIYFISSARLETLAEAEVGQIVGMDAPTNGSDICTNKARYAPILGICLQRE